MLIDLHAHSSGISHCCRIPASEVVKAARDIGIDGIVLTNHYQKRYVTDGDYDGFAQRYVEEYRNAKKFGDEIGCHVFFGIEVTMEQYVGVHLLVYGVDESFALRHPMLFDYSQEELYRLVKENGGALVQAHPLRRNVNRLLDIRYLDGVEISCHPLYESTHFEELSKLAKENGIILTCGGDYHADTHRTHCGVYLPDHIKSGSEISEYLCSADSIELCVQEVDERHSHDVVFHREKRQEI